MSKKDMDRRKKFILELMGDPIYQPMRLREISSLLRLSKEEKDFVKNYIYDLLMKKSPEEIYNKYKPSEDLFNKCKEVFSPNEYHDLYCIKTEFLDKLDQNPDPKDEEAQIFFSSQI